jgi:ATP-dependent Clp protease protease subunit
LTEIYVDHCKGTDEEASVARERFEKALERDYYMTAQEAKEFGIVDHIVQRRGVGDGQAGEGKGQGEGERS